MFELYSYRAVVASVHDGDTVTLDVDLGFGVWARGEKFRLFGPDPDGKDGLNAPEMNTEAGKLARDWLRQVIPNGAEITIRTVKDRREKYGRYLAVIYTANGANVNQLLIDHGHAKVARY